METTRKSRGRLQALRALLVLTTVGLAVPASAQGTFGYRKQIQVIGGAGALVGGPHLNFPVLVSLPNDASLLARVAAGGRDIVFRGEDATTCGGPATCMLAHEIEHYDGATGTLVAWVKVPSVNAGTNIYMYYGNAQITRDTETPAGVFDAGDEPTTGLDPLTGQTIQNLIDACHRRLQFSGIMVTHEVPKIFEIVNKVVMLHEGRVIFVGTPEEILSSQDDTVLTFVAAGAEWLTHDAACYPPMLERRKKNIHAL